ncbi:MAG: hypothetical protein QG597_4898 [Actinomycetota bacterium]|nr:hypothetical protein [Actinomycetota bacterium]
MVKHPALPAPVEQPAAVRTVVPADIDAPDVIVWGLSFRQLAILAAGAMSVWLAYSRFGPLLPLAAWVAVGIPVVALSVTLAMGRRDGLTLDAWLRHALALRVTPSISVPGDPPADRLLLATASRPVPTAPLKAETTRISRDGTLTVDGRTRRLIACGTTSVALRSGTEQQSAVAAFGRWLNALAGPAQIVVSAARLDLVPYAEAVLASSGRLPGQAVRTAAADYARFLLRLDDEREPLRRAVVTVVDAGPQTAACVRGLGALGIDASVLDGPGVAAALATAVEPYRPPVPGPRAPVGVPITTRPTTAHAPDQAVGRAHRAGQGRNPGPPPDNGPPSAPSPLAGTGLDRWVR